MQTIQLEKKYCEDCALWKLLTKEESAFLGVPENTSMGTCAHDGHMSEDTYECIFVNKFCSVDDYNCETCSREECSLHREGNKRNGCVKDWRHPLARALH